MEENKEQNTDLNDENLPSPAAEPDITLSDAMAGVFTEPGETYSSVKSSSQKNYWFIPLLIVVIVTIISSFLVMRDEELSSEIREKQKTAMNEQLDKAVKEGTMTREQADQQIEQTQKFMGGGMMIVFGIIGSLFAVVVFFFLKALVYWSVLKPFKSEALYRDALNVLGLAGLITAVQLVVDTVLAVLMGKLTANIGPALLFSEEAVGSSLYKLLAHFDLFTIWYLIIVGIGLAKVSRLQNSKTIPVVFALWIIWVLLTSYGPLGMLIGGR